MPPEAATQHMLLSFGSEPQTVRSDMFKQAIPVLHVSSSEAAEAFYCTRLGFRKDFAYRTDPSHADPCYMGLLRDDAILHLSSFSGDAVPGGVVYLLVHDVDELHDQLDAKNVPISLKPTNQTWGNREMYVKDPDGNCIRFVQEKQLPVKPDYSTPQQSRMPAWAKVVLIALAMLVAWVLLNLIDHWVNRPAAVRSPLK
jgi:catechol 2,3-dioxygenase-like lactoylglutathione lyase family enzyme